MLLVWEACLPKPLRGTQVGSSTAPAFSMKIWTDSLGHGMSFGIWDTSECSLGRGNKGLDGKGHKTFQNTSALNSILQRVLSQYIFIRAFNKTMKRKKGQARH